MADCGCNGRAAGRQDRRQANRPDNVYSINSGGKKDVKKEPGTRPGVQIAGFSWWQILLFIGLIFTAVKWGQQ